MLFSNTSLTKLGLGFSMSIVKQSDLREMGKINQYSVSNMKIKGFF